MRNSVIRKKALEEQRIIRRHMQQPIKFVLGASPGDVIDWAKFTQQHIMQRG
jgi:hypothetical protein